MSNHTATTAAAASQVVTINRKHYRLERVEEFGDTYTAYIPCGPQGGKVDRCPTCGGHADHRPGLSCGL
jgi:hypothetical protein